MDKCVSAVYRGRRGARRSYFECLYRVEEEGNGCNIRERLIKLFLYFIIAFAPLKF